MSPIQLLRMEAVHSYVARDIEFVRDMALKNWVFLLLTKKGICGLVRVLILLF